MSKRGPTKAQQALAEADEWIAAAEQEVKEAQSALIRANTQLEMHQTIRDVLQKTFTRAPRQPAKPTVKATRGSRKRKKKTAEGVACAHTGFNGETQVVCAELEDNPIHDPTQGYAGYHPFTAEKTERATA